MNVLSVCTFDETLELSVSMDGQFNTRILRTGLKHSEHLLPQIMQMLGESKLEIKDLDLLCCTRGPGSFTGLRIGMSALKGLAYGASKPLVSVSTMEVLAWNLFGFATAVVPLLDARKQRYYASVFEDGKCVCPDMDSRPEDLAPCLGKYDSILFTGYTCRPFAEEVIASGNLRGRIIIDDKVRSYSQALVELSIRQFNEKGPDDIGQGPVYLRKSEAEVALDQRESEEKN